MLLCELMNGCGCVLRRGDPCAEIRAITCDSRAVTAGALFVCVAGRHADGRAFAAEAVSKGAAGIVCETTPRGLPPDLPVLLTDRPRRAAALLAARLYGEPARRMTMIGVTGTKGKTTVAHMIAAVLTAAGRRTGIIGTNGAAWAGRCLPGRRTTPEACELQRLLRRMADDGCDACVMEVSSLGLKYDRVAGIFFDLGVFTNLSPDHISPDEHASFAEYRAWKSVLFRRCAVGIVNADDPQLGEILRFCTCRVVPYGFAPDAICRAVGKEAPRVGNRALGTEFCAVTGAGAPRDFFVPMPGRFSVYNALAALTVAEVLDIPADTARRALKRVRVRGRTEPVPLPGAPFAVVLDYAHNEAAAREVLQALRPYASGRLIAVFGCGGERSRLRRGGMGAACAALADLCVLTEDNSRGEPIDAIWADIRAGMRRAAPDTPFTTIADRRAALRCALQTAGRGDLIAVLGKGHETTLERAGEILPFDDRAVLCEEWERMQ